MRRLFIALVIAALTIAPAHAAISLVSASLTYTDFADVPALAGATAITVALTVTFTAVGGGPIMHQWNSGDPGFMFAMASADEISLRIENSGIYGKQTTALNMANGSTYRVCAKLNPAANQGAIWSNGTSQAVSELFGSANIAMRDSAAPVRVGTAPGVGGNIDAEGVSEAAVWTSYVPDWVCEAYGKGFAPTIYPSTLVFYAPLVSMTRLQDVKNGVTGVNTNGGSTAAHPAMFYRGAH
jgi:hypothetical protein